MHYFDDIQFVICGEIPGYKGVMDVKTQDTFSLEFLLSGSMYFGVDYGERVVLSVPAVHWHHPNHSYQYGPVSKEGYHHNFVTFRGARGRRILEKGLMPLAPRGYLFVHQPELFASRFHELIELVRNHLPERHDRAVVIMEELVYMFGSMLKDDIDDVHRTAIDKIADSIRSRPYTACDIDTLAHEAHLSVSHFRRLFRQYIGVPPHEYLLTCKMRIAASQLGETNKTVQQISLEAGYDDPAQFSKLFKNKIGLPPIRYRRAVPRR